VAKVEAALSSTAQPQATTARRQTVVVARGASGRWASQTAHGAEVTAVDDDELRHLAHLADLGGREVHPVAEHHAGHGGVRAVAERPVVDPVAGQVHDAVGGVEERLDDLGAALGDERLGAETIVPQGCPDIFGLLLGGWQSRQAACGVTDDECAVAGGRQDVAAHRGALELPDESSAHPERHAVLLGGAVVEQLPRVVGRALVDDEHEVVGVRGLRLEVVGEEQLEEGPGRGAVGRRGVHE
jgi:hypothetical protein